MIQFHQLETPEEVQDLKEEYLHSLPSPLDGMWESFIIRNSTHWKITINNVRAGYYCVDSTSAKLLQFYIKKKFLNREKEIFQEVLSKQSIQSSSVCTAEFAYLSLCLDFNKSVSINTYLFHDNQEIELCLSDTSPLNSRKATEGDLKELETFYRTNTGGDGSWIPGFLRNLVDKGFLFIFCNGNEIAGAGECIISQVQTPYADVGVIVAKHLRGKGIATFILSYLRDYCRTNHLKPICSCTYDNKASKRAIEKVGFISHHRIIDINFR